MNFISNFKRIENIKIACSKYPDIIPLMLGGIMSADSNLDEESIIRNTIIVNDFITVSEETNLLDDYKDLLYQIQDILRTDLNDILIKKQERNDKNDV